MNLSNRIALNWSMETISALPFEKIMVENLVMWILKRNYKTNFPQYWTDTL